MSRTISMPLQINPYVGVDMSIDRERKKYLDWSRGAGDRYAHAHGPLDSDNQVYMEGYNTERTNGDLTK